MTERKFIIHPGSIEKDLASGMLSPEDKAKAEEVLRVIRQTIQGAKNLITTDDLPLSTKEWGRLAEPRLNGDVYVLSEDDVIFIRDCVVSGDEVEIMGAYTGICVKMAAVVARETGAVVKVSKEGVFDRKSFFDSV